MSDSGDVPSVRDAVRSLDSRLGDLRRETSWRAIERSLDEKPVIAPAPVRAWRLPVFVLATVAVVIALVVLPKPTREPAATTAPAPVAAAPPAPASEPPTTLSAAAGQRTVFERDGIVLTLVGPSIATVHREPDVVRVGVIKGLVVTDRAAAAPALAIDAGDNHVVSRDARFAVRVEPTMVVLGAGEQARQIVERHALEMGAAPVDPAPVVQAPPHMTRAPAGRANQGSPERRPPTLPDLRMDAAELYKRAEAALAIRDPASAREHLERLIAEYPADPRVDAARYDLALIARSNGQHQRARELLDQLIATGADENLTAAARRLRPTLSSQH